MRSTDRKKTTQVKKLIVKELANWGITKKTVGPILFTISIAVILHAMGVAFETEPGQTDEDHRVDFILRELKRKKALSGLEKAVSLEDLKGGLYAIAGAEWRPHYM